jgi:hypothetical protein
MGVVPRQEATASALGLMMAGVRPTAEPSAPASSP